MNEHDRQNTPPGFATDISRSGPVGAPASIGLVVLAGLLVACLMVWEVWRDFGLIRAQHLSQIEDRVWLTAEQISESLRVKSTAASQLLAQQGYGDRVLIDNLSFSVPKGAIIGVIGGNGAGKSTLFRMITGKEQPDSGTIEIGETVQIASVDQSRENLDGNKTVWEQVSDGFDIIKVGNYEMPSRGYVGRFNFKGADQQKFVKDLSGGERGRLHMALTLKQGANVLLLDEPSNDLDVETLRALEEALLDFPGSAIVISHDRWFLDRIATHILAYEDDSHVEFFEGNYTEYEADRKKRLGEAATQPHRVRYKKLA